MTGCDEIKKHKWRKRTKTRDWEEWGNPVFSGRVRNTAHVVGVLESLRHGVPVGTWVVFSPRILTSFREWGTWGNIHGRRSWETRFGSGTNGQWKGRRFWMYVMVSTTRGVLSPCPRDHRWVLGEEASCQQTSESETQAQAALLCVTGCSCGAGGVTVLSSCWSHMRPVCQGVMA